MIGCGVERLQELSEKEKQKLFGDKRIGLVTSISAVTQKGKSVLEVLHNMNGISVCALFGPEHGIRGDGEAGEEVKNSYDEKTKLPVYSLYEKNRKHLTKEMIKDIDTFIYDIQDIGSRYYTYIATLYHLMEICTQYGKEVVVLDRPNPLGGERCEGNLPKQEALNFVCAYPMMIRHGLTIGEIANMFRQEQFPNCQLKIVKCINWNRRMTQSETKNLWVPPSPNIPNFMTALIYPGTCLVEGTNLSEGRGTANPFQFIGAPFIKEDKLIAHLQNKKLPGVLFLPAYFTPSSSKYQGKLCKGIQIHITDKSQYLPVRTGIEILESICEVNPSQIEFVKENGNENHYFLDQLWGGNELRKMLEKKNVLLEEMEEEQENFLKRKKEFHLYA